MKKNLNARGSHPRKPREAKRKLPKSLAPLMAGSAVPSLSGRRCSGGRVEGPSIYARGV